MLIGLTKAENIIRKDIHNFNKFLENNKLQSRVEIKKAEDETKQKQQRINDLKSIQDKKANKFSQNAKHLEKLDEYFKYKEFQDKLTPESFFNNTKQKDDTNNNLEIDKYYNMSLPNGLIDLINSNDDEFEMYFKHPDSFVQIFHDLELKNQFLIRTNQDIEQNNDDIKKDYTKMMKDYDSQIEALGSHQKLQKQKIEEEKRKKKALDRVRSDKEIEGVCSQLDLEIKKACEQLELGKDQTPIDMLKKLEKIIDEQLQALQGLDKNLAQKIEKGIIDDKMREKKEKIIVNAVLNAEEKKKKILEKTGNKRVGRPIMFRSKLNQEEKQEVNVDIIDEEEEDNLRYFS